MGLFVKRGFEFFSASALFGVGRLGRSVEGPLLPFDFLAARDVDGRSLVKAQAAGGGGRRPAFTRVRPSTTIGRRDRRAEFTSLEPARAPIKSPSRAPDIHLPFLDASGGLWAPSRPQLPVARRRRASFPPLPSRPPA